MVTPDDHVTCGDEDLPFISISELDYLRRTWPRAVFAFMTRYQQDFELKRKEGKERFGTPSQETAHIVVNIFRWQAYCFLPPRPCSVVALPSYVVYSMEGNRSGLH